MKLYKLTDSDGTTLGGLKWGLGVTHTLEAGEPKLCTNTVLHAYTSPLLAALMNPAHGAFRAPLCFEVEGEVAVSDGTKVGAKSLTVTGVFEMPSLTVAQRIAFGIYCALEVCSDEPYRAWAESWLAGRDRSNKAAAAARSEVAFTAAAESAFAAFAANAASDIYTADAAAHAASEVARTKKLDFQALAEKALEIS